MGPGEIVTCVANTVLERCLTIGKDYMVLDACEGVRNTNFGEPSLLVRSDEGQELWFLRLRFRQEAS